MGSPPHTRGRFKWQKARDCMAGFTPAYAGKILPKRIEKYSSEVHPRIRGEDFLPKDKADQAQGSPPHTRGRFHEINPHGDFIRFTPAYAGKISSRVNSLYMRRVHPRIRGEDRRYLTALDKSRGSPPHTRGRFHEINPHGDFIRFTPAYAGKISSRVNSLYMRRVHPRIRGEDSSSTVSASSAIGSPPHTRGRSVLFMPSSISLRFTPAYAGKISASSAVITSP